MLGEFLLSPCRVTDKSVMAFLSLAGKERWKGRAKVKYLVLVDDHSTAESLGPDKGEGQATPLLALRDALFKVWLSALP